MTEGSKVRLARLLPNRTKTLELLKNQQAFASLDFETLENLEDAKKAEAALTKLVEVSKANVGKIPKSLRKNIQNLVYSFTVERDIYLQNQAIKVYKEIFTLFVQ